MSAPYIWLAACGIAMAFILVYINRLRTPPSLRRARRSASAPYFVSINYAWTGHETTIPCEAFDEALDVYKAKRESVRGMVNLYGDGMDCYCGPNGFRVCSDGLTDDERERVEAIG